MKFQEETTLVDGKTVYLPFCIDPSCRPTRIWYVRYSRMVAHEASVVCEDCRRTDRLGPEDVHKALEPQRLKERLAELQKPESP